MTEAVQGLEAKGAETPWCVQCTHFLKWPYHDECIGCLRVGGRPAETVSLRTVHWDVAVLHAVIRRKVAVWEARHPGWELVPDMQRLWEDSTHPSKYVDRETGIGRKMAWTRFSVERKHPRGRRAMGQLQPGGGPGVPGVVWSAQAIRLAQEYGAGGVVSAPAGQGVRVMAEPQDPEAPAPAGPEEPADVPEPGGPEPAAPAEAQEAPA